jgi:leader peptidase (prepilin peptidase)/N-methyltransferase
MLALRLIVCAVLAVPAGWFAALLAERVPAMGRMSDGSLRDPHARGLLTQPPGLRFDGREGWMFGALVVMYVLTAWRFADQPAIVTLPYLIFWCGLVALVATDLELHRLPDRIVLPTLMVGLAALVVASVVVGSSVSIRYAIVGGLGYFGALLVLHLIYPGFAAFGDVKAGAIVGAAVAWTATSYESALVLTFYALLLSYVLSAVVGVVIVIAGGGLTAARRRRIGMGPWMVLSCFLIVMFSTSLV